MTKQAFKNEVKNNNINLYGYASLKQYIFIKDNKMNFKKDLTPIRKAHLKNIGSDFKNIDIEIYGGYIILIFKDTQNIAVYKKEA